jgi:DMSO/TMAO reductase YedYZ molybdopterin-dependent catalytic subunit
MEDIRLSNRSVFLVLLASILLGGVTYIAYQLTIRSGNNNPVRLDRVEVKDYKGKKLSSINDFVENSIKGPQYINKKTYELSIKGQVAKPLILNYQDVTKKYRHYEKVVRLDCVEGWSVTILWEGVLVKDMLDDAVPKKDAKTVIFYAYDGYSTSFPISYFYDKPIIMSFKMNKVEIPPERGWPFMLVAEDKWGYKWVKWITEIELSKDTDYEGYWERRGYSNTGDRNKPF